MSLATASHPCSPELIGIVSSLFVGVGLVTVIHVFHVSTLVIHVHVIHAVVYLSLTVGTVVFDTGLNVADGNVRELVAGAIFVFEGNVEGVTGSISGL